MNAANMWTFKSLKCMRLLRSCEAKNGSKTASTENALNSATSLSNEFKDHVGAQVLLATALVQQKQVAKAKIHLKAVERVAWEHSLAEYFERGWLLLAEIYMQSEKLDRARDLLTLCLTHNRSCYKAHEHLGTLAERSSLHKEAAICFGMAWTCCGCSNPAYGYKMAHRFLKAKEYIEAIQVCHEVLKKFPTFVKIRTDIMEKARMLLRL